MTDVDILHESAEGAETLVDALQDCQAIPLLLHNLSRMDEQVQEERDGVHNTLGNLISKIVNVTLATNINTYNLYLSRHYRKYNRI